MNLKLTFALCLLVTTGTVFSDSGIQELKVHNDTAELSAYHTKFKLTDAVFMKVPSKIKMVPGICRSDFDSECTKVKVLERTPVVQVNVEYLDGIFRDEGRSQRTQDLTFNLPVSSFTAEDLKSLKEVSGFDFTGRKRKARKLFADSRINLEVTEYTKPMTVIDLETSELCEVEHYRERRRGCVEVRNYKVEHVKMKKIKVSVK